MTKKEEIELAILYRKRNSNGKGSTQKNEYAEINTFQLFILEDRLHWVERKIARREKHDYN